MVDLEESWRALLTWMDEKHGWNSSDLKVEWKDVPGELRLTSRSSSLYQI